MNLELNQTERDYLLEVLRNTLGELKPEIHRTETADYKEELRAREAILVGLIARLESVA